MSDPPTEPLRSELRALLEAERDAEPAPSRLERVWPRVERSLLHGAAPLGSAARWTSSQLWAVGVAAFLGGALVGGAAASSLHRPQERVVHAPPLPPMASPPTPALVAPPAVAPLGPDEATAMTTAASAPRVAPVAPAPSGSSLYQERLLLDEARSALSNHAAARALSLLDEHARRFGRPQLAEEREALAVQALVSTGRYDDARARAARFRSANPGSLFLPAIDATLASIP